MNTEFMSISCEELRELAEENPAEMEVVVEMMIEAEVDLCDDDAA